LRFESNVESYSYKTSSCCNVDKGMFESNVESYSYKTEIYVKSWTPNV